MRKEFHSFVLLVIGLLVLFSLGFICYAQDNQPAPQGIIIKPSKSSPLEVKLELDKSRYRPGKEIKIELDLNKKAYLYLYSIDTEGKVNLLFPNRYEKENYVGPGVVSLPGKGYSFLAGNKEGTEYLQTIASTQPLKLFTSIGPEEFNNNPFPRLSSDAKSFALDSKEDISSEVTGETWATNWTRVNVTRKTSDLSIVSYPQGAKAYVDGKLIGKTPGTFPIEPGTRKLTLELSGYENWATTVRVQNYEKNRIEAKLRPETINRLTVKSTPSGADVYLDGKFQGKTPLSFFSESGTRNIRIDKRGYESWKKVIDVQPYLNRTIEADLLEIQFSRISLDSTPREASVFVEGEYRGKTPTELRLRANESREIVIKKESYEEWSRNLILSPNQRKKINVNLTPSREIESNLRTGNGTSGFSLTLGGVFSYVFSLGSELEINDFVIGGAFRSTGSPEIPERINWVPKTWRGGEVLNYGPEWEGYLGYQPDLLGGLHLRIGSGLAVQPTALLQPLEDQTSNVSKIIPLIQIGRNAHLGIKPHMTVHAGFGFSRAGYTLSLLYHNRRGPILNFGFNF